MKFNLNFMQFETWKFSNITLFLDKLKNMLNTLDFDKSFINIIKLFRMVIEIDQKKQAPWIFYLKKENKVLLEKLFQLPKVF